MKRKRKNNGDDWLFAGSKKLMEFLETATLEELQEFMDKANPKDAEIDIQTHSCVADN